MDLCLTNTHTCMYRHENESSWGKKPENCLNWIKLSEKERKKISCALHKLYTKYIQMLSIPNSMVDIGHLNVCIPVHDCAEPLTYDTSVCNTFQTQNNPHSHACYVEPRFGISVHLHITLYYNGGKWMKCMVRDGHCQVIVVIHSTEDCHLCGI